MLGHKTTIINMPLTRHMISTIHIYGCLNANPPFVNQFPNFAAPKALEQHGQCAQCVRSSRNAPELSSGIFPPQRKQQFMIVCLVVEPTPLKNMSQIGNLPQVGGFIKKYLKPPPSCDRLCALYLHDLLRLTIINLDLAVNKVFSKSRSYSRKLPHIE